jgi:hypothetical protein
MDIYQLDTIFLCVCSIFIVQDMAPRTGDVDHPLISIDHSHTYTCYIVSNLVLVLRWGLESDTIGGMERWQHCTRKEKVWIGTCTNNGARLASCCLLALSLISLSLQASLLLSL